MGGRGRVLAFFMSFIDSFGKFAFLPSGKHFRMTWCWRGVPENLFSMRFCEVKVRPTWRIFAKIVDFHKIRKSVLAVCRGTAGDQRVAGRVFRVVKFSSKTVNCGKRYGRSKFEGWWAEFSGKSKFTDNSKNSRNTGRVIEQRVPSARVA